MADFSPLIAKVLQRRGLVSPVDAAFARPVNSIGLYNAPGAMDIAANSAPVPLDVRTQFTPAPSIGGPSQRPIVLGEMQERDSYLQDGPQGLPQDAQGAAGGFGGSVGLGGPMGGFGGYVPGKRPDLLPVEQKEYQFPTAPVAPSYAPIPERNLQGERRALGRGTGLAGAIGLLLGGAGGAVAGAGGYSQGAQEAFDNQFGQRAKQVQAQNQMLQQGYKDALGGYDAGMDALRLQMQGDDRDAALTERINADRMREYNQSEANNIRVYNAQVVDQAKAKAREIAKQRADAGDLDTANRILLASSMIDYRKEQADTANRALDVRELLGMMNIGLGYDRLAETTRNNDMVNSRTVAHQKAMEGLGAERNAIGWMKKTAQSESESGKPLTDTQRAGIERELANAREKISQYRNVGKAPEKFKDPAGYQEWLERKDAGERAAQDWRDYLNTQAARVGKVYDEATGGYKPAPVSLPPRTKADPGWDATMRGIVGPKLLDAPPKRSVLTAEGRGLRPSVNPAAQSGNREAMSRTATPAPRPSPAPRPRATSKPTAGTKIKTSSGRSFTVLG